jgi:hypothetical protein
MSRYTKSNLMADIAKLNDWLKDAGSTRRLVQGHSGGHNTVDAYTVDDVGDRIGNGVDHNVQCGTARECNDAASDFYANEYNRIENAKSKAKVDFADYVLGAISDGLTGSEFKDDIKQGARQYGLIGTTDPIATIVKMLPTD